MVTGNMSQYSETNFNRLNDIAYNTYRRVRAGFLEGNAEADPGTRDCA